MKSLGLVFITMTFVSCTIHPPHLSSYGIDTKDAISFLKKLHDKTPEQISSHIQYLREGNYSHGFKWTEYWNTIKEEKLYKKWTVSERNQVFSLSTLSCSSENWSTFLELLITIGYSNSSSLLFHQYLNNPEHSCSSVWISNTVFKGVVDLLSKKRVIAKNKDPYTIELQKVLIREWIQNRMLRSWSFILKDLDDLFWVDARRMNFQNGDLSLLKNTLEMEFNEYKSIRYLNQDILLMFRQSASMSDAVKLMNYNKYFQHPFMNWEALWRDVVTIYPSLPQGNSNISALMSLRVFSCQRNDVVSYLKLAKQWRIQVNDVHVSGPVIRANWCLSGTEQENEYSFNNVKSFLNSGIEKQDTNNIYRLTRAYRDEKHIYPASEWKLIIEKHFSESDWLNVLRQSRSSHDAEFIQSILSMHQQVYGNQISFLNQDILSVLISNEESLLDLFHINAYKEYLVQLHTLTPFWRQFADRANKNFDSSWKDLLEFSAYTCDSSYLNFLFNWSFDSNFLYLLLDNFDFDKCNHFSLDLSIREKILDFLILQIRQQKLEENSIDSKLLWRLIRVISFYSSQNRNSIEQAVLKLHDFEWDYLIQRILSLGEESGFSKSSDILKDIFYIIPDVYRETVVQSVCLFFNQKNSYTIIQSYKPELLMSILKSLEIDRSVRSNENTANNCSPERMNVILFISSYLLLENVDLNLVSEKYIISIWNHALRIIDMRDRIFSSNDPGFEDNYQRLRHYFSTEYFPEYDQNKVEMSNYAFKFYFSIFILEKLSEKMTLNEVVEYLVEGESESSKNYHDSIMEYTKDENFDTYKNHLKRLKRSMYLQ